MLKKDSVGVGDILKIKAANPILYERIDRPGRRKWIESLGYEVKRGETMTVLKAHHRTYSGPILRVRFNSTGREADMYWIYLRGTTEIVEK